MDSSQDDKSITPHIDGLVQDCSISSALALEILQSCSKPSIWAYHCHYVPLPEPTNIQWRHYSAQDPSFQLIMSIERMRKQQHSPMKTQATQNKTIYTQTNWTTLPRLSANVYRYVSHKLHHVILVIFISKEWSLYPIPKLDVLNLLQNSEHLRLNSCRSGRWY